MSTTTTRMRRHGAALFTIGAVAALAAGCSAGPAPVSSAPAGDEAGTSAQGNDAPSGPSADEPAGEPADVQPESRADAPADVHDAARSGQQGNRANADDQGDQGDQGDEGDEGDQGEQGGQGDQGNQDEQGDQGDGSEGESPAPPASSLPAEWAGTLSAEKLSTTGTVSYVAMQYFNVGPEVTTRNAEQLENGEFLGGADAQCEGDAVLDGEEAVCTFTASDGTTVHALVSMVPTGFGNTALLFGVSDQEIPEYTVAPGAPLGLQAISGGISAVTDEDLADTAMSAVIVGDRNDGDLPPELTISCEVTDGGQHGWCDVAGTPDGGGDGTWYATAQNGYDGDRAAYLFTQLPQD